jgi:hypothetical protein
MSKMRARLINWLFWKVWRPWVKLQTADDLHALQSWLNLDIAYAEEKESRNG